MDMNVAVRAYIMRMLTDVQGMKSLVLDEETVSVVSTVLSQSDVLQQEVFLVEQLHKACAGDAIPHVKAVLFVRPSHSNAARIADVIRAGRHMDYTIFFSNAVKEDHLRIVAEADPEERVREVHEFFADVVALDRVLFSANLLTSSHAAQSLEVPGSRPRNALLLGPASANPGAYTDAIRRCVQGLASVLLSFRKRPTIRFQGRSESARRIAQSLWTVCYEREASLFDFRHRDSGMTVLVLDRRDDPLTPLLSQWTYQAMCHEVLGIKDNRVAFDNAAGNAAGSRIAKEGPDEVVLSADQDPFFAANMYANYGDLGANVRSLVEDYQKRSKATNANLDSIEAMKQFLESYPELKRQSKHVSKHVSILSDLSLVIERRHLMDVSALEQSIAVSEDSESHMRKIRQFIEAPTVGSYDKLRLVLLFALRYEKSCPAQVTDLITMLTPYLSSRRQVELPHALLRACGQANRQGDLFGNATMFASAASTLRRSVKGVDNVYTQHEPQIVSTVSDLLKGRLKETEYPVATGRASPAGAVSSAKPRDVLIFIAGGVTYVEARAMALLNEEQLKQGQDKPRILLGSSALLNSSIFLDEITNAY